jgi:dihydrodipicolinate synthase/N-acetylneuraminate lyase
VREYPELQEALSSPIPSIRTPFTRGGEINFEGLDNYLEHCLGHDPKSIMLTYGNSLYSLLTDDEIAEVTKFVVERVRKRAAVIAATGIWWTGKAAEFGRLCRQLGADILMVLPPDWGRSSTHDTLVAHYSAVGAEIPVMVVTNYLVPRGMDFGLEAIRQVYERCEEVVAVKDDFCNEFGRRMTAMVRDRWTVISGGQKQNHFQVAPYGCQGHLSTLMVFKPTIARKYWDAITSGDYAKAATVVRDYDMPLVKTLLNSPGGPSAAVHAWSEIQSVSGRWRRAPYYDLTDEEVDRLRESLDGLGLL